MAQVAPLDPTFALTLSRPAPSSTEALRRGPLDDATFPETLTARVVTPGPRPRLHGYDVEADLALHYGPTDLLCLSLTGELPSPATARALEVALVFAAPLSIAHASVHAAALARLCGTATASLVGVAAIGLAEQVREQLDGHAELLAWLAAPAGALPERFRATDPGEHASVERLRTALAETGLHVPLLDERPTRDAALFAVLFACGLRQRAELEAALVSARLPSAVAEALAERVAGFDGYPTNLPRYAYRETP